MITSQFISKLSTIIQMSWSEKKMLLLQLYLEEEEEDLENLEN